MAHVCNYAAVRIFSLGSVVKYSKPVTNHCYYMTVIVLLLMFVLCNPAEDCLYNNMLHFI